MVCESIRPELQGKLILLGFFGVCPNVEVALQHLDQPAVLTFLLSGGPGDGTFFASFDILDESNQQPVVAAAPVQFFALPNAGTHLATTLLVTFGHTGQFSLRCIIDGIERFRGAFRVKQGPPPSLQPA